MMVHGVSIHLALNLMQFVSVPEFLQNQMTDTFRILNFNHSPLHDVITDSNSIITHSMGHLIK